jgi:hypothetical protein
VMRTGSASAVAPRSSFARASFLNRSCLAGMTTRRATVVPVGSWLCTPCLRARRCATQLLRAPAGRTSSEAGVADALVRDPWRSNARTS